MSHHQPPMDPDPGPVLQARRRPGDLLAVLLGGVLGTLGRDAVGRPLPTAHDGWPTATFVVNLLAAFVLGVVVTVLTRRGPDRGRTLTTRLFLGTGICGALSTYSTFAVEVALLARAGEPGLALTYALVTVAAGLVTVLLGMRVARSLR